MTTYDLSGRFGTFRAAGVAKARANGASISLDRASRNAGGVAVSTYFFGVPAVAAALVWPLLLWPAGGCGVAVAAQAAWLVVLGAMWALWHLSGFARRSEEKGARLSALTYLGEAIADSSGAFDWRESILFMDSSGVTLTVYRTAGVAELRSVSPELVRACEGMKTAYQAIGDTFERLEVHAMKDGQVRGTLTTSWSRS